MKSFDPDSPFDDLAKLDAQLRSVNEMLQHPAFTEHVGMRVLFRIEHDERADPLERRLAGRTYARHRSQTLSAFRRMARVTGSNEMLANFLALLAEHDRLP